MKETIIISCIKTLNIYFKTDNYNTESIIIFLYAVDVKILLNAIFTLGSTCIFCAFTNIAIIFHLKILKFSLRIQTWLHFVRDYFLMQ